MRRRIISLALLLLPAAMASAQNGFFVSAELGSGSCNVTSAPNYKLVTGFPQHYQAQDAITAVIDAGVFIGQWEFKMGFGYLRDGYISTYNNPADPQIFRDRVFYPHIIMPFTTGWQVKLSNRWSMVPHFGVILGTNTGRSDLNEERTNMSSANFNKYYRQQSIWVTFDVEARYRIGRRHALFLAPHYNMMVTEMAQDITTVPERNSVQFKGYTINIGISRVLELKGNE